MQFLAAFKIPLGGEEEQLQYRSSVICLSFYPPLWCSANAARSASQQFMEPNLPKHYLLSMLWLTDKRVFPVLPHNTKNLGAAGSLACMDLKFPSISHYDHPGEAPSQQTLSLIKSCVDCPDVLLPLAVWRLCVTCTCKLLDEPGVPPRRNGVPAAHGLEYMYWHGIFSVITWLQSKRWKRVAICS